MDKVEHIRFGYPLDKYCLRMLQEGYIYPPSILGTSLPKNEDPTLIYCEIIFKGYRNPDLLDFTDHVNFFLDKKIIKDKDFFYGFYPLFYIEDKHGPIDKKLFLVLLNERDPKNLTSWTGENEILFKNKISLKKYLIGAQFHVHFDSLDDFRIDLIYYCPLEVYCKYIINRNKFLSGSSSTSKKHKGGNDDIVVFSKESLKRVYTMVKQLFIDNILKYTDNILFVYAPHEIGMSIIHANAPLFHCNDYKTVKRPRKNIFYRIMEVNKHKSL